MTMLAMATVYGTVTTVMLALMRVVPDLFGSLVIRRSLVNMSALSFVALVISLLIPLLKLPSYVGTFVFGVWFIALLYHFGFGVLLRIHVRANRFKDYGTVKNLRAVPPMSNIRRFSEHKFGRDKKKYEVSPLPASIPNQRNKYLKGKLGDLATDRPILLLTGKNPASLRKYALHIAIDLIKDLDHDANFVCCTTSPEEVWSVVTSELAGPDIDEFKKRFVIIDAYTRPFGFRDEVLDERVRDLDVDKKVHVVSNATSAASIHSSTAKAFHILKKTAEEDRREGRRPCVMVYDTLSIMAVSETDREVAQFVVHLTAAEMAYGMFTIMLEPDISSRSSVVLDVLRACCGTPIDVDDLKNE